MPDLEIIEITNTHDYISHVEDLGPSVENPLWYRGISLNTHGLTPSLYRHNDLPTGETYLSLERKLLNRFDERSKPFLADSIQSDWERMFIMQHYGMPTRLLDWTENPLVALFFAITDAKAYLSEMNRHVADPDLDALSASVWLLSPHRWNAKAFEHMSYNSGPLSPTHHYLNPYISSPDAEPKPPALPAAIFGIHNSSRIVAQRGVFTIFGADTEPMESMFENKDFDEHTLARIDIPYNSVDDILKRLLSIGYADSVIYPDLEGLARETKRIFRF